MSYQNYPDTKAAFEKIIQFLRDGEAQVFVLKGYAGTGKTTLINDIAKVFLEYLRKIEEYGGSDLYDEYGLPNINDFLVLMAPTGNAAQILACKTELEVRTIHSTIYQWDAQKTLEENTLFFNENSTEEEGNEQKVVFRIKGNPLNDSKLQRTLENFRVKSKNQINIFPLYIIDESSMISDKYKEDGALRFGSGQLLKDILEYTGLISNKVLRAKVIFVGDPAQLPPTDKSVFAPALNEAYLKEKYNLNVQSATLTIIKRQKEGSKVLKQAEKIRKALETLNFYQFSIEDDNNEIICLTANKDERRKKLMDHYIKESGSKIIITFTNEEREKYNAAIRKRVFSLTDDDLKSYQNHLIKDDHLVIVQNNYLFNLLNGDFVKVMEEIPISEQERSALGVLKGKPTVVVDGAYIKMPIPSFYRDNAFLLWKKVKVRIMNTCDKKEKEKEKENNATKEILVLLNPMLNTKEYPYPNDSTLRKWLWINFLIRRKFEVACFFRGAQRIKKLLMDYKANKNYVLGQLNRFEEIPKNKDKVLFIIGIFARQDPKPYQQTFEQYLDTECYWDGSSYRTLKEVIDKIDTSSPNAIIQSLERLQQALFNIHVKILQEDRLYNCIIADYGYAVTCHKAQGNEWDVVFIDWTKRWSYRSVKGEGQIYQEDFFRWAYTAITRARKKVYNIYTPSFDYTKDKRTIQLLKQYQPNGSNGDLLYELGQNRTLPKGVVGYFLHKLLIKDDGTIDEDLVNNDWIILANRLPYLYSAYKWSDTEFSLFAECALDKLTRHWGTIEKIFIPNPIDDFMKGVSLRPFHKPETENDYRKKVTAKLLSEYARSLNNIGNIKKIETILPDLELIFNFHMDYDFMDLATFSFFTHYLAESYLTLGDEEKAYNTILKTLKKYKNDVYTDPTFAHLWNLLQKLYENYHLKKLPIIDPEVKKKITLRRLAIWEKATELFYGSYKNKKTRLEHLFNVQAGLISYIMYNSLYLKNVNPEDAFIQKLIKIAKRNCEEIGLVLEEAKKRGIYLPERFSQFYDKRLPAFKQRLADLESKSTKPLVDFPRNQFFETYLKPIIEPST